MLRTMIKWREFLQVNDVGFLTQGNAINGSFLSIKQVKIKWSESVTIFIPISTIKKLCVYRQLKRVFYSKNFFFFFYLPPPNLYSIYRTMVLPQPTSSRLSLLKNKRNSINRSQIQQQQQQQRNMNDYLKKSTLIPHRQQTHRSTPTPTTPKILSETQNSSTPGNKILDGVVACLDVR